MVPWPWWGPRVRARQRSPGSSSGSTTLCQALPALGRWGGNLRCSEVGSAYCILSLRLSIIVVIVIIVYMYILSILEHVRSYFMNAVVCVRSGRREWPGRAEGYTAFPEGGHRHGPAGAGMMKLGPEVVSNFFGQGDTATLVMNNRRLVEFGGWLCVWPTAGCRAVQLHDFAQPAIRQHRSGSRCLHGQWVCPSPTCDELTKPGVITLPSILCLRKCCRAVRPAEAIRHVS